MKFHRYVLYWIINPSQLSPHAYSIIFNMFHTRRPCADHDPNQRRVYLTRQEIMGVSTPYQTCNIYAHLSLLNSALIFKQNSGAIDRNFHER